MIRRFVALALMPVALSGFLGACGTAGTAPTRDITTASDQTDANKRARTRLELASGYFAEGKTTTALDEVKLALVADPSMVEAYNLRGLIYAAMGEQALAEESFRHAMQIKPNDGSVMHNFGWYLCQQKRYPEAQQMFARALAVPQYREASRTFLTQGVCQARNGQLPEAEQSLMRAYELDPASPAIAVNLTEVLLRRGDYERARFYIGRVNGQPELSNAQTLWLAVKVEKKLGNQQAVQELGNQLRNRYPKSPEALAFDNGRFDE